MNRWRLTSNQKEKFVPLVKEYINKLKNMSIEEIKKEENNHFKLDLYNSGITPYPLKQLLEEEFGYKEDSVDKNGWELDFWIRMSKIDNHSDSICNQLTISGCGMTFELSLCPEEFL